MIIIDLEASGLLEGSYPIEVAWGAPGGDVASHLIKPEPGWTHWSSEAEKVHRLSRDHLQAHGTAAGAVATLVHAELAGRKVYSDAPDSRAGADVRYLLGLHAFVLQGI